MRSIRISQRKLEQQLLAALSANLLEPRPEEERVQSFRDQLEATLAAETRRTREAASQDSQLKEELAGLKKEQENLVDGIAKHGFSPALSARLAAVESRIVQSQKLRTAGVEPKVPEITTDRYVNSIQRKSQEFANILAGDAAIAREQLRKRITKLVLRPKRTQDGSVFEVTGDVSLFQVNGDVMLTNSLDGVEPPTPAFSGLRSTSGSKNAHRPELVMHNNCTSLLLFESAVTAASLEFLLATSCYRARVTTYN